MAPGVDGERAISGQRSRRGWSCPPLPPAVPRCIRCVDSPPLYSRDGTTPWPKIARAQTAEDGQDSQRSLLSPRDPLSALTMACTHRRRIGTAGVVVASDAMARGIASLEAEDLPISPLYLPVSRRPRSGRRSLVSQPALERTRTPLTRPCSARCIHCTRLPRVVALL